MPFRKENGPMTRQQLLKVLYAEADAHTNVSRDMFIQHNQGLEIDQLALKEHGRLGIKIQALARLLEKDD